MEKGEHLTHKEICYRIFNGPIDKKLQAMQARAKKTKAPVADILVMMRRKPPRFNEGI